MFICESFDSHLINLKQNLQKFRDLINEITCRKYYWLTNLKVECFSGKISKDHLRKN